MYQPEPPLLRLTLKLNFTSRYVQRFTETGSWVHRPLLNPDIVTEMLPAVIHGDLSSTDVPEGPSDGSICGP
jgi:hypothetical protein